MIKDKFNWKTFIDKTEITPFEERVILTLEGVVDIEKKVPYSPLEYKNMAVEINNWLNRGALSMSPPVSNLMLNSSYGSRGQHESMFRYNTRFKIEKVIFNDPATIIIWKDGTKTVVKIQEDDTFDPMVGMAMCIAKKAMGNQGNYFEVFKEWCEPWYEEQEKYNGTSFDMESWGNYMKEVINTFVEKATIHRESQTEVSPKVCRNCRHCLPFINGNGHFCGYGGDIKDPQVESCIEWSPMPEPTKKLCINCKYCDQINKDKHRCDHPNVVRERIAHPEFENCTLYEPMPEPKQED